ncbi:HTH-type transcriptional activator Btr [Marinomonas aquimarina]|uniref:HTH-type transcriptional activator Btr n=1 Tax=Marinomonas aquimarina TaxID=295068 RepID=A0A1A8TCK9_9GAMM|nr:AraC family transcriptional regulator [Marinomonas aquimarina]SBS29634.1 HTH-type transcriptional activator Btr [Marinomonas aquimarina]
MLAIPLPFVVSLLLLVLAGSLWGQRRHSALLACGFLLLCALTTALVGLRWTFDLALLRMLQPIFASLIPVVGWWVFSRSKSARRPSGWHALLPMLIAFGSLSYPLWEPPIDALITAQYVLYSLLLWRSADTEQQPPEYIRLSDWVWAIRAQRIAALMLLFSALIDGALTLDFLLAQGQHAMWILSLGHALLLPTLALAVMSLSLSTSEAPPSAPTPCLQATKDTTSEPAITAAEPAAGLSEAADQTVVAQVTKVVVDQQMFLDPDLTLARLARKSGIPARQISAAINRVTQQNISQWVNQYRIAHAAQRLASSDDAITQIYLDSGFQTKSNFHREFSRIMGMTPSQYRQSV